MTYNFDFRGHISPFGPKITPENWSFKAKNNAQTASKQLQTRFQKFQKTIFLATKKGQITGINFGKCVDWGVGSFFLYLPYCFECQQVARVGGGKSIQYLFKPYHIF